MRRGTLPLTIALLVVGVLAVVVTMGVSPTAPAAPGLALAGGGAGPTATPGASSRLGPNGAWNGGRGWSSGPGMMGGRNAGGLGQVSISAIVGTKVSLQSSTGWTRTIDVTGVTIQRAGSTITVSELKVGDRVALGETRDSTGTYTLKSVTVVLDKAIGTVSKIGAASITVTGFGGGTSTITTTGATTYRRAGSAITRGDIAVGERITASGTTASDGSLAADAIDVQPDVVFGTVTGKSGSTLTIKTAGGGTATVTVSPTTTYRIMGKASATLADIAVNDQVVAQGVSGAAGTLAATSVQAGTWRGSGFGAGRGDKPSAGPGALPQPTSSTGTSG
jgi:hypothetical protein